MPQDYQGLAMFDVSYVTLYILYLYVLSRNIKHVAHTSNLVD